MHQSESDNFIQATIIGNTHVRIQRLECDTDWNQTVHAINWFDARQLQLYNFYNFLASRSVDKVGGVPMFKGRLLSPAFGSDEDKRQVLLLVKYPSPKHFKKMLSNTYFKCVSLLRSLAVKRFTFCLSHKVGAEDIPVSDGNFDNYGIHHFRGDLNTLEFIKESLKQNSMHVSFSSLKTHQLFTVSGDSDPEPVPAIMDGIVLFKCEDESTLHKLVNSEPYKKSLHHSTSSYVGLYQRIM